MGYPYNCILTVWSKITSGPRKEMTQFGMGSLIAKDLVLTPASNVNFIDRRLY